MSIWNTYLNRFMLHRLIDLLWVKSLCDLCIKIMSGPPRAREYPRVDVQFTLYEYFLSLP